MRWKVLIVSLVVVFLVAFIGSLFTDIGPWYESIKPDITPPNFVFPIAWNILFFLIALSLFFAWTSAKKEKKTIAIVFSVNFILNILWSVFFFTLKNPLLAFVEIIVLWASILVLILVTWKTSRLSSYLLWPYLAWVSFAAILNYLMAF